MHAQSNLENTVKITAKILKAVVITVILGAAVGTLTGILTAIYRIYTHSPEAPPTFGNELWNDFWALSIQLYGTIYATRGTRNPLPVSLVFAGLVYSIHELNVIVFLQFFPNYFTNNSERTELHHALYLVLFLSISITVGYRRKIKSQQQNVQ